MCPGRAGFETNVSTQPALLNEFWSDGAIVESQLAMEKTSSLA